MKTNKKGFTLLEMLVVVLIIGILAAIALPQYQTAVEKSKATEALTNIRNIIGAVERNILLHGTGSGIHPENWDIELSGGTWDNGVYITDNFIYDFEDSNGVDAFRCNGKCEYTEDFWENAVYDMYGCYPSLNGGANCLTCEAEGDKGQKICKALEGLGVQNES